MIDTLGKKFKSAWNPGQVVSVDEAMAATECFRSSIRVNMPSKPVCLDQIFIDEN